MRKSIFYAAVLILILTSQKAFACQCSAVPPTCYAYWESDAVFVGRVKRVFKDLDSFLDKVEVDVEENFRGMSFKTAFTYNLGHSCAWSFEEGQRLLFFGSVSKENPNYFGTHLCTRTGIIRDNLSESDKLSIFEFFRQINNPTRNYLILGNIFQSDIKPLSGIKVEIIDNDKKIAGISDKNGNFETSVSKEGKYRVRVFLPLNTIPTLSELMVEQKIFQKMNLDSKKPYIEYEVEVRNNKCGWFNTNIFPSPE